MDRVIDRKNMFKKNPWGTKSKDAKVADKKIKFCLKCKSCWEVISNIGSKKQLIFYDDFPTYGKQRKICKLCKG